MSGIASIGIWSARPVKKGEVIPVNKTILERDEAAEQSARISGQHRVKQARIPPGQVAPVNNLRERILAVSLFPNLFNRSAIMR